MEDFKRIWEALVAGIDTFQFTLLDDVEVFPPTANLALEEWEIQLKAGKAWRNGFAIDDTLQYGEPPEESAQGDIYRKRLEGILPHDDADIANNFYTNRYQNFLIKYVDRGGVRRLLGTPEEPMRLRFSYSQAANHAGQKGWSFTFFGDHTVPALYLTIPDLPQLWVDDNGDLFYAEGLDEDFDLVDGDLLVDGDQQEQYELENGKVYFDENG